MDRIESLKSLESHPMLGKVYAKLTATELVLAESFAWSKRDLDKGDFDKAVTRLFLDREKPKHWKEICELLSCANSALP